MSKITIETENIVKLAADGKTFMFNPDAEESIAKLLKLQTAVEAALEKVKMEIANQGEKENPNFTGVRGSKIRASYSYHGALYKITAVNPELALDPELYTKKTSYSVNKEAVENYIETKGGVPKGIEINKRKKSVSLKDVAEN